MSACRHDEHGRRRRTTRGDLARAVVAAGVVGGVLVPLGPFGGASATSLPSATAYGGFSTSATATPLRIEVHEPAIPVPADPQAELNFSYTRVEGSSGPNATARASAMWPGAAVGEGLKTIVEQVGLPSQLGAQGYPVQVNAQSPGESTSASQEMFPGMVGRVNTTEKHATAQAGYSTSGQLPGSEAAGTGGSSTPTNPLDALKNGDLSALGGLLTGSLTGGTETDPAPANPLGALSAVLGLNGMSSYSRTDFDDPETVKATATTQLGGLSLALGLVKLDGITVSTTATSSLSGAKTEQKVAYGRMTIAGTPFAITSDGFEAAGSTTAIPGLSDLPSKALAQLGISIDLPKPEKSVAGSKATVTASGPRITIDTAPLRKIIPSIALLPQIAKQLPAQAGQLSSLLLALDQAKPKIVVYLGTNTVSAETVAGIGTGGGAGIPTTGGGTTAPPAKSSSGAPPVTGSGSAPTTGTDTAAGSPPSTTAPVQNTSGTPGLPALGSVPGALTLGAIALGGFTGWWLRRGTGLLFGAGGTCPHGLESGLPDLRKV
jgi:hypothetical protein